MRHLQNIELQMLQSTKQDLKWLNENYASVLNAYDNQFVAIKDQRPVASASSLEDLLKELKRKKIDPLSTLIKYMSKASIIL